MTLADQVVGVIQVDQVVQADQIDVQVAEVALAEGAGLGFAEVVDQIVQTDEWIEEAFGLVEVVNRAVQIAG